MKITLICEDRVGSVSSRITASWSEEREFSLQDVNAFLMASLTSFGSRLTAQEPQINFPVGNLDKGFLHDGHNLK